MLKRYFIEHSRPMNVSSMAFTFSENDLVQIRSLIREMVYCRKGKLPYHSSLIALSALPVQNPLIALPSSLGERAGITRDPFTQLVMSLGHQINRGLKRSSLTKEGGTSPIAYPISSLIAPRAGLARAADPPFHKNLSTHYQLALTLKLIILLNHKQKPIKGNKPLGLWRVNRLYRVGGNLPV